MPVILALGETPPGFEAKRVEATSELLEHIARLVESGERVLVYGAGVWRLQGDVTSRLSSLGLNYLLVEFLDPREAILAREPVEKLVAARLTLLSSPGRSAARVTIDSTRRVSRRVLVREPYKLISYRDTVYVRNPRACIELRACPLCTTACPYDALEGRPPAARLDACRECGLCTSYCPVLQLSRFSFSPHTLWDYLRLFRGPGYAVFACRGSIARLVEESSEARVVLTPVWCPGDVTLHLLLAVNLLGLKPAVACKGAAEKCGTESVEKWLREVAAAYTLLTGEHLEMIDSLSELKGVESSPLVENPPADLGRAARLAAAALAKGRRVKLDTPLSALLEASESCTLCGACAATCPHGALEIVEEGGVSRLVHNSVECTGCLTCTRVCPEGALRGVWGWPGSERVILREEEMVKCRVCGRPFAPKTLVEATARRLREKGLHEKLIQEIVYTCPDCRVKRLFEAEE